MLPRIKQTTLFFGDIFLLYGCLFIALLVRYGKINDFLVDAHLVPFSLIFILWIAAFYAGGLYDLRNLKKGLDLVGQIALTVVSATAFSILIFYLVPYFKISPKTNLVIFSGLCALALLFWRWLSAKIFSSPQRKVLVIGRGKDADELESLLIANPHLGYKMSFHIKEIDKVSHETLSQIMGENRIDTIIIGKEAAALPALSEEVYRTVFSGIEVVDVASAYETIFKKIPLSEIHHLWVLTSVSRQKRLYEVIKRPLEFLVATLMLLVLSPVILFFFLLVILTSKGPGIYRQTRVGKYEKLFTLYKLRTMRRDAETDGPQWADKDDSRITFVGRFLRFSHLDELPQLINIMRNEISFVGPRPERPEFVKDLKNKIPYYEVRHLIKPGITGWAQTNYRYGASIEDSYEKLRYDMFYLKNRSLLLDFLIILKTIKLFFVKNA